MFRMQMRPFLPIFLDLVNRISKFVGQSGLICEKFSFQFKICWSERSIRVNEEHSMPVFSTFAIRTRLREALTLRN